MFTLVTSAPDFCPVCGAGAKDKFKEQTGEHDMGCRTRCRCCSGRQAKILWLISELTLKASATEVGMYLAMARVAHREGYPEVGLYYEKAAYEEAEHAAKFAELLGEVVTDSHKEKS